MKPDVYIDRDLEEETQQRENTNDWHLVRKADVVANTPDGVFEDLARRAVEVSQIVDTFDYAVVTGASGIIAQTLLQASGVATRRVVLFTTDENGMVYKHNKTVNLSDRVTHAKNVLAAKGIDIGTDSTIVVEDRVVNGAKAIRYVDMLSQVGVSHFGFITYSAPKFNTTKYAWDIAAYVNRNRAEGLLERLHFPSDFSHEPTSSTGAVDTLLANLADVSSAITPGSDYYDRHSSVARVFARPILTNALSRAEFAIQNLQKGV